MPQYALKIAQTLKDELPQQIRKKGGYFRQDMKQICHLKVIKMLVGCCHQKALENFRQKNQLVINWVSYIYLRQKPYLTSLYARFRINYIYFFFQNFSHYSAVNTFLILFFLFDSLLFNQQCLQYLFSQYYYLVNNYIQKSLIFFNFQQIQYNYDLPQASQFLEQIAFDLPLIIQQLIMNSGSTFMLALLILVQVGLCTSAKNIEKYLDIPEYCLYHGYPTETHIVHTKDGYNLKFFRLQGKNKTITNLQKVVYLQHGLEDSADTWVLNSQDRAPGFVLANQGYDVWLGNIRGNHYSNPQLSPRVKNFWDFSFDQMVEYDLPSAFQYINNITGKKIHYIGHSQGSMIMFGALSERNPIVRSYLASFSGIGPGAYLTNQDSVIFTFIAKTPFIKILQMFDVKELLYSGNAIRKGLSFICQYLPFICSQMLSLLSEKNNSVNNLDRISNYVARFPCGSSIKNFEHFKQLMKTDKFCKYDYGEKINIQKYGTKQPPNYTLKNIQFPVHLFVGEYDRLADIKDAQRLYNELGSKQKTWNLLKFGHMSFVWGKDMSYLRQLIQIIEENQ